VPTNVKRGRNSREQAKRGKIEGGPLRSVKSGYYVQKLISVRLIGMVEKKEGGDGRKHRAFIFSKRKAGNT